MAYNQSVNEHWHILILFERPSGAAYLSPVKVESIQDNKTLVRV